MSELVMVNGLQPALVKDAGGKRKVWMRVLENGHFFPPSSTAWHRLHPCRQADTLLAGVSVGMGWGALLLADSYVIMWWMPRQASPSSSHRQCHSQLLKTGSLWRWVNHQPSTRVGRTYFSSLKNHTDEILWNHPLKPCRWRQRQPLVGTPRSPSQGWARFGGFGVVRRAVLRGCTPHRASRTDKTHLQLVASLHRQRIHVLKAVCLFSCTRQLCPTILLSNLALESPLFLFHGENTWSNKKKKSSNHINIS